MPSLFLGEAHACFDGLGAKLAGCELLGERLENGRRRILVHHSRAPSLNRGAAQRRLVVVERKRDPSCFVGQVERAVHHAACQSSAGGSGLAADKIAEVCKCTAEALIEKYEPSELMGMKPEEAMPVMKECAAKSGLPV